MLNRILLAAALLVPQVATAADLPRHHHRHRFVIIERVAPASRYIACSTSSFVLFSVSNCGGFDPLGISGM